MNHKVYSVEYTLKNGAGEVIDTNVGVNPLEFISGKKQMIPGFEKVVLEMNVGEEKEFVVNPNEGYGEYREDLVQVLPREQFEGIELKKGMTLYGQGPNGHTIAVTVKNFDDEDVTIDYNHPLAGEQLFFNVKVLSERDATADEISTGYVGGVPPSCGCGTGECSTDDYDECDCETGCSCH